MPLRACHACGLVHTVGDVPPKHRAFCTRCNAVIRTAPHPRAAARAAAFALSALLLYPIALSLPILTLTELGHTRETTIWSGMVSLLAEGQLVIGLVVLFCSVIAPLFKLGAIFALSAGELLLPSRHRAVTYRLVEMLGRWGMLDVVLVAVLVAAVKLGDIVEITPGPGLVAFTTVVVLSLLASAFFDPHSLWNDNPQTPQADADIRRTPETAS
ncbi:MAG: paraquat-inducible protein A [Planctomycetota bacterium]|nr:paraquat-inducible protein A [Planctomycetota bacterium]